MNINNEIFVFPITDDVHIGHKGMTLRDYFAGQALMGYIVNLNECSPMIKESAAKHCYEYADAMMEVRGK